MISGNDKPYSALINVGADAVKIGLVRASGGNLSVLNDDGTFWITGTGTWLDRLSAQSFTRMSLDGKVLDGPKPSVEWKLHARSYQVREDVKSVIHFHPQYTLLVTALGYRVRFITQDHAYYVGRYGQTKYYHYGTDELADKAAQQIASGENNVVVLGHHGISAVGESVESAFRRALNMEEAAIMTYRALLLDDMDTEFPADELAKLRNN